MTMSDLERKQGFRRLLRIMRTLAWSFHDLARAVVEVEVDRHMVLFAMALARQEELDRQHDARVFRWAVVVVLVMGGVAHVVV